MNSLKIVESQDVAEQVDVMVEITETITPAPVIVRHCCSMRDLQATIDLLNERKAAAVAAFDAEIAVNQGRLDSIQAATMDVKLSVGPVAEGLY